MRTGTRSTSSSVSEGRRRTRRRALPALLFAAATLAGGSKAWAADAKECAETAQRAQSLRGDGLLRSARAESLSCAREGCPEVVRRDCERWLGELDEAIPTLVIRATDGAGHDLIDVQVTIDGERLLSRLDGRAVPVDPGPHRLTVIALGRGSVSEEILVAQAEKNRRIVIKVPSQGPPEATTGPGKASRAGLGPEFWVAGAIAAVALASFAYFGVGALDEHDTLSSSCAPLHSCTSSDRDTLRSRALIADVSLGVSIVAIGAAVWFAIRGSARPHE